MFSDFVLFYPQPEIDRTA